VGIPWFLASRVEARDFALWLKMSKKPARLRRADAPAPGSVNPVTGKATQGENYAARTRRHARAVVRSFYEYHREAHGRPLVNPFPNTRGVEGEHLNAHHNPMRPFRRPSRRASYQPKEPKSAPRSIPDQAFNELFAALTCHRDRALLAFYISTGARASELLGVRQGLVEPGEQVIGVVRKGSRALQRLPASADARSEMVFVRAFYEDIARWAADDPAHWAPWVAPCPIKASEVTRKKFQARVKARMDQRTRTQLPLLPALARAVDRQRKDAEERINIAKAIPAGDRFTACGEQFERGRVGESGRVYVRDLATGKRRDLSHEESAAFWSWATVEVLRHTGIRIEEMLELTHHSFVAYTLPTTGEVVPMLQVAPSKTDSERLLLVSPELAEVLTAIIFRVRAGNAALPLVSAYDVFEQTWSPPMPFLFQRRFGTEDRPLTRSYIRECLVATSQAAQITAAGQPLEWRPHDFRRIFVTDAIRSGLPPHVAAKLCGHSTVDTTMGYAAIYPEDVITHHRAFIARRRAQRPSEEYRDLTAAEWDEFLAHFELRKVALGTCGRDYGSPCAHENACVRCPLLRVDPAQMSRLQEIHANLVDRLAEAKEQGWLGEVAALETTMTAAEQKLDAMRAAHSTTVHLGLPVLRSSVGRSSAG
jgi:integrase